MINNSKIRRLKGAGLAVMMMVVSSCDCNIPLKVTSIQKGDKKLACKDIILEINEAEHYRSQAIDSRKISIGEVFMPTCWLSGYVDGEQSIKSSDARIDYLGHIYDLLDCGGLNRSAAGRPLPAARPQGKRGGVLPPPPGYVPSSVPIPGTPLRRPYYQPPGSPYTPKQAPGRRRPANNSDGNPYKKDEQGIEYRPIDLPKQ